MIWGTRFMESIVAKGLLGAPVRLDKQRCRTLSEHCGQPCVAKCPQGALEIESGAISGESCISCGSCVTACPISAPSFTDLTDLQVIQQISRAGEGGQGVGFVCQSGEHTTMDLSSGAKVKVACIARLYPGILIMPVALGAKKVLLDTTGCDKCINNRSGMLAATIDTNLNEALMWLEILGQDAQIRTTGQAAIWESTKELEHQSQGESRDRGLKRRELFKLLNQEIKTTSANLLNDIMVSIVENIKQFQESKQGKQEMPLKKYITSLAIGHILKESVVDRELPNQHLPEVLDGCTLCQICSKACPTAALSQVLSKTSQQGAIYYQAAYCISCSLCVSKCPEQVLSFNKPMTVGELVSSQGKQLFKQQLAACSSCKALYVKKLGKDNICHICYEKELKRMELQLSFH